MKANTLPIPRMIIAAVAGLVSLQTALGAESARRPLDLPIDSQTIDRITAPTPTSFAPMLEKTTPAVVAVYTAEIVRVVQSSGSAEEELLRRLFGLPTPYRRNGNQAPEVEERKVPVGTGSGVIVRKDGFILTNNHVVIDQQGEDADEILVRLGDGRELPAEIVGRDPKTDVAVLKVEATDLPAVRIADSDQIKVGDVVFAIGNPMGVGLTVTQGIVSARNRAIGIYGREGYENFIQTDAAINVGNSGGALVDTSGRLIGLNSAILSRSGGSVGIGFAIPSNLAVSVTRQLSEFGEVKRGFLGVNISNITPDMAEAFGLENAQGVLIDDVEEGLAAAEAGLQRGDIVTSIDGRALRNINELRVRVGQKPPGTRLEIGIVREGNAQTVDVVVGDRAQRIGGDGDELFDGITVAILDDEARKRFGIPARIDGIVVTQTDPSSPYNRYLDAGTVILEINDQRVRGISDARSTLRRGVNKLYVYAGGRTGYLALRVR